MLRYGVYLVALGVCFFPKTSAAGDKLGPRDGVQQRGQHPQGPAAGNQLKRYEVYVEDVHFRTEGNKVHVFYTLIGRGNYEVSLRLSNNGGQSFSIVPRSLSGAVGADVNPGINNRIVWDVLQDIPNGLEGDNFVFAVIASEGSRRAKNIEEAIHKSGGRWRHLSLIVTAAYVAAVAFVAYIYDSN